MLQIAELLEKLDHWWSSGDSRTSRFRQMNDSLCGMSEKESEYLVVQGMKQTSEWTILSL